MLIGAILPLVDYGDHFDKPLISDETATNQLKSTTQSEIQYLVLDTVSESLLNQGKNNLITENRTGEVSKDVGRNRDIVTQDGIVMGTDLSESPVIEIKTNSDFIVFPGSGTSIDPYIIEGYNISLDEGTVLISIRDTNVYFIIRNNYLSGGYLGIALENVENGIITNNIISSPIQITRDVSGIILQNSSNNTISSNIIAINYFGIYLHSSTNNTILSNTITKNPTHGIQLVSSMKNLISSNKITNCSINGIAILISSENNITNNIINSSRSGISLEGSPANEITHNLLENNGFAVRGLTTTDYIQSELKNNTINGKDLIYWVNIKDTIVPEGAGQIILINCMNIEIANQDLSNASNGILLFYSSNIYIHHNIISNNSYRGIYLYYSTNNTISFNTITINYFGIYLDYSFNNTLLHNSVADNSWFGIECNYASNNVISYNTLANNSYAGLDLSNSLNNMISFNYMIFNTNGINLFSSSENIISSNIIINSTRSGVRFYASPNNTIVHNTLKNNGIFLEEGSIRQSIQTIMTNNTINDKELIYWVNINGLFIPDNVGQIILVNCTNIEITNHELSFVSTGISLSFSSNIYIHHNVITNNSLYGIYLINSINNMILFNTIANNTEGIYFHRGSRYNFIWSNNFIDNISHTNFGAVGSTFINNFWSGWALWDDNNDGISDNPYYKGRAILDPFPKFKPITFVIDTNLPVISNQTDLSYVDGTVGNTITWNVEDDNPGLYYIINDNKFYVSYSLWSSGNLSVDIDGLSLGMHTFTINIFDVAGNIGSDTVIVTVDPIIETPSSNATSDRLDSPISILAFLCLIAIPILRRKTK